jgi:truncated hemoglobin YjbI
VSAPEPSAVDQLGGVVGVGRLVNAFLDEVFRDPIIGFWFEGRDQARIRRHEAELAVAHLGGPRAYTGRGLPSTHKPLGIHRGHFRRRLAILRTVLAREGVPEPLIEAWVAHDAAMQAAIVVDGDCV